VGGSCIISGSVGPLVQDSHREIQVDRYSSLHEDVAYAHLSALSPTGYEVGAAYALLWTAIEQLDEAIRWIALGGGAGVQTNNADGLSRFKRGWSTETRTAYFCGRTLDPEAYKAVVEVRGKRQRPYFPAYRCGEFR
jgi:hypothetical protein